MANQQAKVVRTDWRQRVPTIVAEYDVTNGRWTNVNRKGIADATRRAFDGVTVGQYREKDKLLPIVLRAVDRNGRKRQRRFPRCRCPVR